MERFLSQLVLSNWLPYRLGRHVLFWVLCVFFFVSIYGSFWNYQSNIDKTYIEAILFLPAHMIMSYTILYVLIPRYLLTGRYFSLIMGIIILIPVTALISYGISTWLITPFRNAQGFTPPSRNFFVGLLAGLRGSNTVAGFAVSIKLVKFWYFKKEENAVLEKEKLKAELEVLKGQLHPHFLFNTLNNLYSLILQKSQQAPDIVLKLAELLRYMLTESQKGMILLSQEISILKHYIDLEQARFGGRLELSMNINGNVDHQTISPLLLLPLVENAFKHGANEMVEHPWISLDLCIKNEKLKLKLINGKPLEKPGVSPISSGIGLQNLQKRLALQYPNRHRFEMLTGEENFTVNLELELNGNS